MSPVKKPPPDTEGNVRGRVGALKVRARQAAHMDEGDPERALAKRMGQIEPQLQQLRARLAKVREEAPAPEPPSPSEKDEEVAPPGDLLATLGGL